MVRAIRNRRNRRNHPLRNFRNNRNERLVRFESKLTYKFHQCEDSDMLVLAKRQHVLLTPAEKQAIKEQKERQKKLKTQEKFSARRFATKLQRFGSTTCTWKIFDLVLEMQKKLSNICVKTLHSLL